ISESIQGRVCIELQRYLLNYPVSDRVSQFAQLTLTPWVQMIPCLGLLRSLGNRVKPFFKKKKKKKISLISIPIQTKNPFELNKIRIKSFCLTKMAFRDIWRS
uniref:Uncharacterized protein n=1 Tax=Macaca fascicularis TaxID=9541 RepID=A0A7N9IDG6_MACFA